jgi:hypothetical protein
VLETDSNEPAQVVQACEAVALLKKVTSDEVAEKPLLIYRNYLKKGGVNFTELRPLFIYLMTTVNLPRDKPGGFSPFETAPQKRSLTISR